MKIVLVMEGSRQAVVEVVVLGTEAVVDVVEEPGTVVDVLVGTVVVGTVVVGTVVVGTVVVVVVAVATTAQVDSARATKWEEQISAELLPAMEQSAAIRKLAAPSMARATELDGLARSSRISDVVRPFSGPIGAFEPTTR
jgi:hypothetical protein